MQLSLHLPRDICQTTQMASPGRAAQKALRIALQNELPATQAPDATAFAAPVYIPMDVQLVLRERADGQNKISRYAESLIWQWCVQQRNDTPIQNTARSTQLPETELRDSQVRLGEYLLDALEGRRIAMAEASTGIGKSRTLAVVAKVRADAGHRVTIGAPSIKVMLQIAQEFETLGYVMPALYLGQGQFVVPERIREMAEHPDVDLPEEERERIQAWDGRPKLPHTKALQAYVPDAKWLTDDLDVIAPSLSPDLVRAHDAEHEIYSRIREQWSQAPIRIATHALIAANTRLQRNGGWIFDSLDTLLLDEAHLFYDAVSRVYRRNISMFRLRAELLALSRDKTTLANVASGKRTKLRKQAERASSEIDSLLSVTRTLRIRPRRFSTHDSVAHTREGKRAIDAIRETAERIAKTIQALSKENTATSFRLKNTLEACQAIQRGERINITLSPRKNYPSIDVGIRSLRKVLQPFWESVESAALVSGTLFTDTRDGISAGYYVHRLGMPAPRIVEIPRIVAPWLYSTPTIMIPPQAEQEGLVPVSRLDDEDLMAEIAAEREYYDRLSAACQNAARKAVGGTLILCNSYHAINELQSKMSGEFGTRLLVQHRGDSFNGLADIFRDAGEKERLIWLATGNAWTGLDMRNNNVSPQEDRLLTDVIIPRLPVPAGSMEWTRGKRGMDERRIETAFRLRQGIGRLVRAQGQPDRRLWLMDGRLWATDRNAKYLTAMCRRAIERYPDDQIVYWPN